MTLPERPFEGLLRMIADSRARIDEERRLNESDGEGSRPETERANSRLAPTRRRPYVETLIFLNDVAKAAKHAEASQSDLDRAIATALHAGAPKTQIAKAANLSPQALSNRIRRDRRRDPKDRRYGQPPD